MYRCIQLVLLGHFSVEQNTHLVLFLVEDDPFFSCSSLSETVLNFFLGLGLGFGAAKFSVLWQKKNIELMLGFPVWCRVTSIKFYWLYFLEPKILVENTPQHVHIFLSFRHCRQYEIKHCLHKQADDGSFEMSK